MKYRYILTCAAALIALNSNQLKGQLTPHDAINSMGRGINIGNTFDPSNSTGEGTWRPGTVVESSFDDFKNAGFSCVRIPITWGWHASLTSPYTITASWMNRIEQVVDWGLERNMIIIINAHHESWLKNDPSVENQVRFDSIWSQIATRFKDKSDSLLFEMINEPYPMTLEQVDSLNTRILSTIRKTNPTRIVLFSGHMWSNSAELAQAAVPGTADNYLIGYYHSYDPYPFGLEGTGTYGSDADIATTESKFQAVANWSNLHNIPAILSEYGYIKDCEYNARMCAYATINEKSLQYNIPCQVWDDGGDFPIYDRPLHSWNEIKDIIVNTYTISPNKMVINNYADTLVKLQWKNRTTENDSIIIERRIDDAGLFTYFTKISPTDSVFIDSNTFRGITYYYRLKTDINDTLEIQSYPIRIVNVPIIPVPYLNTPIAIPGTIEVENFDIGIEGQTYHDSDPLNLGEQYRPGVGVDIYKSGSNNYIGNVEAGEWLAYTVNVTADGEYIINAYAGAETAGGEFIVQSASDTASFLIAEATQGLTSFEKISNTIQLSAGEQMLHIKILNTPEFTLNKLTFSVATSVDDNSIEGIRVYPNPATDQVIIEGVEGLAFITVYNLSGTLIKSVVLSGSEKSVPINSLEEGVYILKCTTVNDTFTQKIMKAGN